MSKSTSINSGNNSPSSCSVRSIRGNIYLMGEDIDVLGTIATSDIQQTSYSEQQTSSMDNALAKRRERDGQHFHMTLLTKGEHSQIREKSPWSLVQTDKKEEKDQSAKESVEEFSKVFLGDEVKIGIDIFVLGLGQDPSRECFFLVVAYPRGEALRKKLGLPKTDFHITIAFEKNDMHNCDKGVNSLLFRSQQEFNESNPSLDNMISSSFDLATAAEERLLGGKPTSKVSGSSLGKKDYQGAGILLNAAQMLFQKENGFPITEKNIGKLDAVQLELARDILLLHCQLMGRKGEFESMLTLTETLLEVQSTLLAFQQSITRTDSPKIREHLSESQRVEASALGYRGYAFMKTKQWSEAYPCLERSYELRNQKIKSGKASSNATKKPKHTSLLKKKLAEESIVVERILATCCEKLGIHAPLPPLTTFPRTAHLFDCGGTAVTSDDLVISGDSALFEIIGDGETQVIVEEKIDGANMGFSLSSSGQIITQNRNHYVSSADHSQFGPLTEWVAEHRLSLVNILTPPDHKERVASQGLILFGEWMTAKHSIPYHKLPGRFVAFDLYDRLEKKFYSRSRFHRHLSGSQIPTVPIISAQTFGPYARSVFTNSSSHVRKGAGSRKNPLENDLRRLLDTKSRFRSDDGFVEGVVLRIEERQSSDDSQPQWLEHRAKIVRPDFIGGCQDGHWMRNDIVKQTIDLSFAMKYMSPDDCYCLAPKTREQNDGIKISCNAGFSVKYKDGESCTNQDSINPRRRLLVSSDNGLHEDVILPRNLSFLWANEVAISSTPKNQEQIAAFRDAFNISLIVTLTEEQPLIPRWFEEIQGIENKFVPIPNYMAPTEEQMDDIMDAVENVVKAGGSVMVHCGGGKGRAGTIAACLLLKFGFSGIRSNTDGGIPCDDGANIGSNNATEYVQRTRPGSIETEIQEQFIRNYARLLWKRRTEQEVPEQEVPETEATNTAIAVKKLSKKKVAAELKAERQRLTLKKQAWRRAPRCVILMGLPGSGKSTFSARLEEASSDHKDKDSWIIINQDKMGRKECEKIAGIKGKSKGNHIVLDRCNITSNERTYWLEIMHSPSKGDCALVYFAASADTCKERVANREDHETIPKGRGQRIVDKMSQEIEPPSADEKKRFGSIHILETYEDAELLLHLWGV